MIKNLFSFITNSFNGLLNLMKNSSLAYGEETNFRLISFYIIIFATIIFIVLLCYIYIKYFISLFDKNQEKTSLKKDVPIKLHIPLIVNMLSRGIEPLKIAQSIKQTDEGNLEEDEIIKLIQSIKNFIKIYKEYNTPKTSYEEGLSIISDLYDGNTYSAMIFLKKIIDIETDMLENIDQSDIYEAKKILANKLYIYSNLAKVENNKIALEALNEASYLNPDNYDIWSRIADIHLEMGKNKEAIQIYEFIISDGDEKDFPESTINAFKKLYTIYSKRNDFVKANEYFGFEHYYCSIGINIPLNKEEKNILDVFKENADKENIVKLTLSTNV